MSVGKRLAVYNLQKRMTGVAPLFHPWAVCEAPIPQDITAKDIRVFKTQGGAIEWAQKEARLKVVEPA